MKHFSHFIAPGAVNLPVSGCLAANAAAFLNPDGARVAVVANPLRTERPCVLRTPAGVVEVKLPPESFTTIAVA